MRSANSRGVVFFLLAIPLFYILSSGPMIGLGCWLREATGWDQFYLVFYLYYPMFLLGRDSIPEMYIEWWVVSVFQTVGPG